MTELTFVDDAPFWPYVGQEFFIYCAVIENIEGELEFHGVDLPYEVSNVIHEFGISTELFRGDFPSSQGLYQLEISFFFISDNSYFKEYDDEYGFDILSVVKL